MIGTTKYSSYSTDMKGIQKREFESGGFFQDISSNNMTSSTDTLSKRPNIINPTLRPFTLKQLQEATQPYPDANFTIDQVDIHQVQIIGCIRAVQNIPSGRIYTIEDGTGAIDVRVWNNNEQSSEDDNSMNTESSLREGIWIQVFGQLRSFNNKKSVHVYNMKPIEDDFNEIIYHMLCCIRFHYYYSKNIALEKNQNNTKQTLQDFTSGFTSNQKLVLDVFNACTSNEGLHIQDVCRELGYKLKEEETKSIVDWLLDEGHLYSTIDDYHFKGTISI